MEQTLLLYNTLSRKKEIFEALNAPFVGMYVCGPTVYGDAHLGHARPAITFDLLFRYLTHIGYKVRYVRNITDVGHLENDADSGEDKIAKKARLEQLEPMEVVEFYTNRYHKSMEQLNVLPPSIEPRASGHIIEQQAMVKQILDNGFAYVSAGSVYFDVEKYNKEYNYGKLSGRILDDLQSNTRELDGQSEKRNPQDFALWKKASPEHIMKWKTQFHYKKDGKPTSFTSIGFPGWHLECSVMSTKYLGKVFDIHGGGLDLLFPHHECEIAQNVAAQGEDSVRYWVHNNMITINGQKMGKSLGNFITLDELFSGTHKILEQAYSPMTIRFFILQAQYRSTLDFSNEALQAAEKGLDRLMKAMAQLEKIKPSKSSDYDIDSLEKRCYEAMSDDLNSPILLSHLFDGVKYINSIADGKDSIDEISLKQLRTIYQNFVYDILGLTSSSTEKAGNMEVVSGLVEFILNLRKEAKANKDFAASDRIRDELTRIGIVVRDRKDGSDWEIA